MLVLVLPLFRRTAVATICRQYSCMETKAAAAAFTPPSTTSRSEVSAKTSTALFSTSSATPASDLVALDTTTHADKGIAVLTMQNGPVNSLSLEMLQSMSQAVQTAESIRELQALVVTSKNPSVFSAGLHLPEMALNLDADQQSQSSSEPPQRLVDFWTSFQDLYLTLYGSRLATIANCQGHTVAGGCMIALSCDYRVMGLKTASKDAENKPKQATIGLNESQLGIVAPGWLAQQYVDTIGRRHAEKALQTGQLFQSQQALGIGLVDELVPFDEAESGAVNKVTHRSLQVAQEWARIPPTARVMTKQWIRQPRLEAMKACRSDDLKIFLDLILHPKTQRALTAYLKSLADAKKKK